MNICQLKHNVKVIRRKAKRVGRGDSSGHGGTSCRGHRGQKARAGYSSRPYFEGGQMPLIRRLPKRGFSNARFRSVVKIINIDDLNRFDNDSVVTLQVLEEKGLVKGVYNSLKILGNGELKKKLTVQAHYFSQVARDKIQKANGLAQTLPVK